MSEIDMESPCVYNCGKADIETVSAYKKRMRREIRKQLKDMTLDDKVMQSNTICNALQSLASFEKAKLVMAYAPLETECSPVPLFKSIYDNGGAIVFPRCVGDGLLELYIPNSENSWEQNAYGIWEPIPSMSQLVHLDELDFIIVPGLGYDKNCRRMGRGGGYYDRLLSKIKAYAAGICFNCQIIDDMLVEPHDATVDCVITGTGEVYTKKSDF